MVANGAVLTAHGIVAFREKALAQAREFGKHEAALIDILFGHPMVDIRTAERLLGSSYAAAAAALQNLAGVGCVAEIAGRRRNRRFKFVGYLGLFEDGTQPEQPNAANTARRARAKRRPASVKSLKGL